MIRVIRRRHRVVWLILAVLLPLIFAASIAFRHPEPVNRTIPKRELPANKNRQVQSKNTLG